MSTPNFMNRYAFLKAYQALCKEHGMFINTTLNGIFTIIFIDDMENVCHADMDEYWKELEETE